MSFIESYKHLEKICSELLGDKRGVTAYIEEMQNASRGPYFVSGWYEDLKQLKHYRWVRNRIAHDLNCTEENMCSTRDAEWLDSFYSRIMIQADPLAKYRRSISVSKPAKSHHTAVPGYTNPVQPHRTKKPSGRAAGWIVFFILAALAVLLFVIVRDII